MNCTRCHRWMYKPALTIRTERPAAYGMTSVEVAEYGPKCAKIVRPTPKRPEPAPRVRRVRAVAEAGQQDLFTPADVHQAQ